MATEEDAVLAAAGAAVGAGMLRASREALGRFERARAAHEAALAEVLDAARDLLALLELLPTEEDHPELEQRVRAAERLLAQLREAP